MLQVALTKNLNGFEISGDYYDLFKLYECFNTIMDFEDYKDSEFLMRETLNSFLSELKDAFSCDSDFKIINNGSNENQRDWLGVEENIVTNKNLYFKFNYLMVETLEVILLIRYLIVRRKEKFRNEHQFEIDYLGLFFTDVMYAFKSVLTPARFNKLSKFFGYTVMFREIYNPQYFTVLSVNYIGFSLDKKKKEMLNVVKRAMCFTEYDEYFNVLNAVFQSAEEQQCPVGDIVISEHDEKVEW